MEEQRDIVIQVIKTVRNYRYRGIRNRYSKWQKKNSLWGKLQSNYKKNPPVKSDFNVDMFKNEMYNFYNGKEKQPNTPESGVVKQKLMKWMNQPVKRTIADGRANNTTR